MYIKNEIGTKILIIQQKMVGDVLTCSILLEILRKNFPNVQLDYLINKSTFPVVKNHPDVDNFIFFDDKKKQVFFQIRKLGKKLEKNNYHIIIDAYSKISSNLFTYYSKAPIRISYRKWYSKMFYTHTYKRKLVAETQAGLAIENRVALLREVTTVNFSIPRPKIYLSEKETEKSKTFLIRNGINLSKPLIMISIFGSSSNKTYPKKYMCQLLNWLSEEVKDVQILFNYLPNQNDEVKAIYDLCSEKTRKKIRLDLYGKSLRDFICICYHCSAVIGNEGGAINIGKAFNKKTFSVFSPWIDQEAWSIFEDGKKNASVHFKNYFPEFYKNKEFKALKKQASVLYLDFKPDLFKDKYFVFLEQLNSQEKKK